MTEVQSYHTSKNTQIHGGAQVYNCKQEKFSGKRVWSRTSNGKHDISEKPRAHHANVTTLKMHNAGCGGDAEIDTFLQRARTHNREGPKSDKLGICTCFQITDTVASYQAFQAQRTLATAYVWAHDARAPAEARCGVHMLDKHMYFKGCCFVDQPPKIYIS